MGAVLRHFCQEVIKDVAEDALEVLDAQPLRRENRRVDPKDITPKEKPIE